MFLISNALFFAGLARAHLQLPLTSTAPVLQWRDCGEAGNHTLQCSELEVPVDQFGQSQPAKTSGFSIPLIRMLASNASATGDRHIFLNPGGPGGSGIDFLRGFGPDINRMVGEDFHLLSFDPRGVGASKPPATCYQSNADRAADFRSTPWDIEFQAGEMYTRAENKARACQDTMGEHGKYVNTPQTAADMNSILDALGQEKMYYWGFSYGNLLGQTYAQMFPGRVSRLVLDGVVNLAEWYDAFFYEEAFTDTDRVFAGFVEECVKAHKACPFNTWKNTGKDLFGSPSHLQSYIEDALRELEEAPIPVYLNSTNYGAITRMSLVTHGIFRALYKPSLWPDLASNLAELLLNGNSTPVYAAYSESWVLKFLVNDAAHFITLNDNRHTGRYAPVHGIKSIKNYTLSRNETSNLVTRYQGSNIYERASWTIPTTHDFYPRYYPQHPRTKTAEPILVISTTWDPVCPLRSAKKARDSFEGAHLLEQTSYGHCSLSMPSLCTAKYLNKYFNEGLLPEDGASCDVDAGYFASSEQIPAALNSKDQELLKSLHALAQGISFSPVL
ncbi:alpha/beta-hydrolase [Naviculisporaceae sp. PSN 640]